MVSIIECSSILVTKNFQVFMKSTRKLKKKKLYLDIMLNFSLLYFPAKVQTTIHQSEKDVPEKKISAFAVEQTRKLSRRPSTSSNLPHLLFISSRVIYKLYSYSLGNNKCSH